MTSPERRTQKEELADLKRQLVNLERGKGTILSDQWKMAVGDRERQIRELKSLIAKMEQDGA